MRQKVKPLVPFRFDATQRKEVIVTFLSQLGQRHGFNVHQARQLLEILVGFGCLHLGECNGRRDPLQNQLPREAKRSVDYSVS